MMYKSHTLNYQEEAMKNLTTPKAILMGLGLIALAIAIQPVTGGLIGTANANRVQLVRICGYDGLRGSGAFNCVRVLNERLAVK